MKIWPAVATCPSNIGALRSGQEDADSRYVGRGHVAILGDDDGDYIIYHAYDRQQNGLPTLRVRPIEWTADGWPVAQ